MFRKNKTTAKAASGNDLNTLLDVFDKIISGEISHTGESPADTTLFENPEVANKFNEVVETYKRFNNNFVMRLNEAMESIGDNSYVKNMMDEVQSQAQAIGAMGESGHNLEESINHINVAMADIKDNTHEMLATTQNSTANMNESIKVVNESSEKIADINRQVQEFQDKIHKIGEIVDIVKKVASQSNLLALNASIEAARAGEAGKGFAVVADEIGKLADQSNTSAEQIRQTIDNLLEESEKSVEVMESVNVLVAEQQEKLNQTREKFVRVSKGITTSKDDMEVIKSHTDSYFVARKKVADIIQNLSAISEEYAASTQQTTASMEELNATMNLLAEASKNLTDLSKKLEEEVAFFQLDD